MLARMGKIAGRTGALAAGLLLSGCFLAEDDSANPIIPAASIAYPLPLGAARECEGTGADQKCNRAELRRRPGGGYEKLVWSKDEDGREGEPESSSYKIRPLVGGAIPRNTYLVQQISGDEDARYLGLMTRQSDGGWLSTEPNCDNLGPADFVSFVNNRWISSSSDRVENMKCEVKRAGLTDARLFTILDTPTKNSTPQVLYTGR